MAGTGARCLAGVLFFTHVLTLRTSAQLVLDTFACAAFVWAIVLAVAWVERQRRAAWVGLVTVLLAAMFVKGLLPAILAVPVIVAFAADGWSGVKRGAVWAAVAIPRRRVGGVLALGDGDRRGGGAMRCTSPNPGAWTDASCGTSRWKWCCCFRSGPPCSSRRARRSRSRRGVA